MRIQRPVRGQIRQPLSACSLKIIREHVEDAAHEMKCSKSFVVNTALAHFFAIKGQESFYDLDSKKRRAKK